MPFSLQLGIKIINLLNIVNLNKSILIKSKNLFHNLASLFLTEIKLIYTSDSGQAQSCDILFT